MSPRNIQLALIAKGYGLGPAGADGIWGRASIAALKLFQGDHGLKVDGIVGPETLKAIQEMGLLPRTVSPQPAPPVWFHEAGRLMGTREIPGAKSNAVIMGWAKSLGGWVANVFTNDDIPWCGLFVAHCVGATLPDEKLPANPLSALAWAKFGVALDKPRLGAVVVFKRPGGGHVGFYVGEDAATITVRGGNQSNAVTETRILKSRLVGYRWPATVPLTGAGGPIEVAAKGSISANEA
ncbi:NlpC/P60 family protein [Methylorubrum zatmanii]